MYTETPDALHLALEYLSDNLLNHNKPFYGLEQAAIDARHLFGLHDGEYTSAIAYCRDVVEALNNAHNVAKTGGAE